MQSLDVLVQVLLEADSHEKMKNLLKGLLTPSELAEFGQRIQLVRLLKKGVGQHDIAKKLHIGVATVTRGSKEIKQGNFKYV